MWAAGSPSGVSQRWYMRRGRTFSLSLKWSQGGKADGQRVACAYQLPNLQHSKLTQNKVVSFWKSCKFQTPPDKKVWWYMFLFTKVDIWISHHLWFIVWVWTWGTTEECSKSGTTVWSLSKQNLQSVFPLLDIILVLYLQSTFVSPSSCRKWAIQRSCFALVTITWGLTSWITKKTNKKGWGILSYWK